MTKHVRISWNDEPDEPYSEAERLANAVLLLIA